MLRIHNSLTGEREALVPIHPGEVRMYVCGDTVYDYCHIGHARSKIAFDVVRRYLGWRGLRVIFVRNITDIDDKIIKRANELGEPIERFTERFIAAMHEDYDRLGVLRPDHEPRATQHVGGMVALAQRLIDTGHAYVAEDGDVLYSVSSFPEYGKLSGKRLADLRAGARVEVDQAKRDPLDFVLWKRAKPGEPSWPSPWGPGRPGWHIECSAMSAELLGDEFDIHGGGMDLKFPHHENEIAQSCGATGARFARLWMHNGFVNVDNEKMSKSLGNFFTIREVLDKRDASGARYVRHPEVLRFFLLSSHYRGPLNYSLPQIDQADRALERAAHARDAPPAATSAPGAATARFTEVMDDDFNTPEAVAVLQGLASDINRARDAGDVTRAAQLARELVDLGAVLGVLQLEPAEWFRLPKARSIDGDAPAMAAERLDAGQIDALIAERKVARKARDFKRSDEIRQQLADAGVVLEDKPDGTTTWRFV
ncbi:MAG: cysteine--tRNA ligase [Steroidobacteraceae bacterium]